MAANVQHSSESNEQFTPDLILAPTRLTIGAIDLDPASCALANKRVLARVFYTEKEDGLTRSWGSVGGRVFLNPPGGKDGNESRAAMWWDKLARSWMDSDVDAAIFVAFNLGMLQVTQGRTVDGKPVPSVLDFPICYPSARLEYLQPRLPGPTRKNPDRKPTPHQIAEFEATGMCTWPAPPHPSAIVYLPSRSDPGGLRQFLQAFKTVGACRYDHRFLPPSLRAKVKAPPTHLLGLSGIGTVCEEERRDPLSVVELDLVNCRRCKARINASDQLFNQVWVRANGRQQKLFSGTAA